MNLLNKLQSNQSTTIPIIGAAIAFIYCLWIMLFNSMGFSADSHHFVSCAYHVATGQGFLYKNAQVFAFWPPLFPSILAILLKLNLPIIPTIAVINSVAIAIVVWVCARMFFNHLSSRVLANLCVFGLIVGAPFVSIFLHVWAEPLFCILILGFLHFLNKFIENKRLEDLIYLCLCVAIACMQRYVGVILIIAGAIVLFIYFKDSLLNKIKTVGVFCITSAIPLALWMMRNHQLVGNLSGNREKDINQGFVQFEDVLGALYFGLHNLSTWFMHRAIAEEIRIALMFAVLLFIIFWWVRVRLTKLKYHSIDAIFIFTATYFSFFVAYCTLYVDIGYVINDRLSAPIYPFILLLMFKVVEDVLGLKKGSVIIKKVIFSIVVLGVLSYSVLRTGHWTRGYLTEGLRGQEFRSQIEQIQYNYQHNR